MPHMQGSGSRWTLPRQMTACAELASLTFTLPSRYCHLVITKHNVITGKTIPTKNSSSSDDDDFVCIRELAVVSSKHSPQQLVIRLQGWVHGTPLRTIKWCPINTLVDSGACLGRICPALDDLATSDPGALQAPKRYHTWDGKHLLDMQPHVSHIDDTDQREPVISVVNAFEEEWVSIMLISMTAT